jgi:hypothetical protein
MTARARVGTPKWISDLEIWLKRLMFLSVAERVTPEFRQDLVDAAVADDRTRFEAWRAKFNVTDEWLADTGWRTYQVLRSDPGNREWCPPPRGGIVCHFVPFTIIPHPLETETEFRDRAATAFQKYVGEHRLIYGFGARELSDQGVQDLARYQANELRAPTPDQRQRIRRAAQSIGLTLRPRNPRGPDAHARTPKVR